MVLTAERLGGRLGESLTERTSCERVRFLGVLPGVLDAMAAAVLLVGSARGLFSGVEVCRSRRG